MSIRSLRSLAGSRAPTVVTPDARVSAVAIAMRGDLLAAALVVAGGRLAGIFTERDLVRVLATGGDPRVTRVGDAMTPDPQTIHPDRPFTDALRMMHEGRFRHVPIVEDGQVLGLVSVRDALQADFDDLADLLATHEAVRD